jgi:hypothetical protein
MISFETHQEYEEQRRPLLTSLIAGNSPPPKALQVAAGRKQPQHPLPGMYLLVVHTFSSIAFLRLFKYTRSLTLCLIYRSKVL